jgi:RHS repeat-associated protein
MSSGITQAGSTTWSYDAGGRPTGESDPNGQTLTRSYGVDNTLTSQVLKNSGGASLATWSYLYDNDFRITQQSFSGTGAGASPNQSTLCYHYDPASRVDGFQTLAGGGNCGTVTSNVRHDHDGNRTGYTDSGGNQTAYCYNADDSMSSLQPGLSTPNCTSPPANAKAVQETAYGTVANDGCSTYSYDGFDRLTQVVPTGASGCGTGTSASYTYDALDRQYGHSDSGSWGYLHYDGLSSNATIETSSSGVDTIYELDPSGRRRALDVTNTGLIQYLTDDGKGNISTATSTAQGVACTVRVDAFGNTVGGSAANPCNTGSSPNDFVYRGGRRDSATGDYQFGVRTYDPSKASFLTQDTYRRATPATDQSVGTDSLTANRYNYVNGDPVNLSDPDGHYARHGPDENDIPLTVRRAEMAYEGFSMHLSYALQAKTDLGNWVKTCYETYHDPLQGVGCPKAQDARELGDLINNPLMQWLQEHQTVTAVLYSTGAVMKSLAGGCLSGDIGQTVECVATWAIPWGKLAKVPELFRAVTAVRDVIGSAKVFGAASKALAAGDELAHAEGAIAAASGAIKAVKGATDGAAEAATSGTTLFRAVGPEEAADIGKMGTYRIRGKSAETGKYFFPTQEQAQAMVDRGWATHVTSGVFPQEALDAADVLSLPTEGTGLLIPSRFFPWGPVEMLGGVQ